MKQLLERFAYSELWNVYESCYFRVTDKVVQILYTAMGTSLCLQVNPESFTEILIINSETGQRITILKVSGIVACSSDMISQSVILIIARRFGQLLNMHTTCPQVSKIKEAISLWTQI